MSVTSSSPGSPPESEPPPAGSGNLLSQSGGPEVRPNPGGCRGKSWEPSRFAPPVGALPGPPRAMFLSPLAPSRASASSALPSRQPIRGLGATASVAAGQCREVPRGEARRRRRPRTWGLRSASPEAMRVGRPLSESSPGAGRGGGAAGPGPSHGALAPLAAGRARRRRCCGGPVGGSMDARSPRPAREVGPRRAAVAGEVEALAGHRHGWTELPDQCPYPPRQSARARSEPECCLSQMA
jgi:hypothetical protein